VPLLDLPQLLLLEKKVDKLKRSFYKLKSRYSINDLKKVTI
jgi:hypothetical protein